VPLWLWGGPTSEANARAPGNLNTDSNPVEVVIARV
jgi:hypothetical protein